MVQQEPLCEDPLRLATPRPVDQDTGPMDVLRALADHPWVMEPEGSPARHWATALCRTAGLEPDVRFESADLVLHLRLAELGHAAALLPDLAWNGRPPAVALRELPEGHRARSLFTAVRSGRGPHPAIRACRQALRQAIAP
ncbi:LysR substrate-binding domain-containing protein [Streptomyces sp. cg40]|uniref:LysR substrate-binding domain-containing protein n=1 Tax=Streptomyces sp. cg40 TaxID=3419764 RepID=UPI003D0691C1